MCTEEIEASTLFNRNFRIKTYQNIVIAKRFIFCSDIALITSQFHKSGSVLVGQLKKHILNVCEIKKITRKLQQHSISAGPLLQSKTILLIAVKTRLAW